MPLGRNITRRLGFRREAAAEPSALPLAAKQISLPLNLISSAGLFDDVLGADKYSEDSKSSDFVGTRSADKADTIASTEADPESPATPTLTDASSIENSPIHEKSFLSATLPEVTPLEPRGLLSSNDMPPAIPKRVPSHSKKEHVRLARKRSLRASETSPYASTAAPSKPGFSTMTALSDEPLLEVDEDARFDLAYMRSHGLRCFSAADYQAAMPTFSPWTDHTPTWV